MMVLWSIVAGALAGASTGFLAALVAPFAERRAQEQRDVTEARRTLIAAARAAIFRVQRGREDPRSLLLDDAFAPMLTHLSDLARQELGDANAPLVMHTWSDESTYARLRREVDDLEKKWNLI